MEQELITYLRDLLPPHPQLLLGPGDDAAVLALAHSQQVVVTTDLISDMVDFHLAEVSPAQVGHKALAVNLSDLAAMAAQPLAAVVALSLPRIPTGVQTLWQLATGLYEGMLPLAERYGLCLAGGDISLWDAPLVIAITVLGEPTSRGVLRRSGALPGDQLLVTGRLGGSILGRHLRFEPRVHEALTLHQQYTLHAGMDLSDGLLLDAHRLAAESKCGIEIHLEGVPVSSDARSLAAKQPVRSPITGDAALDHALSDGEDFELLLALPADEAERLLRDQPLEVPICRIGQCVDEPGVWGRGLGAARRPLPAAGFSHGDS